MQIQSLWRNTDWWHCNSMFTPVAWVTLVYGYKTTHQVGSDGSQQKTCDSDIKMIGICPQGVGILIYRYNFLLEFLALLGGSIDWCIYIKVDVHDLQGKLLKCCGIGGVTTVYQANHLNSVRFGVWQQGKPLNWCGMGGGVTAVCQGKPFNCCGMRMWRQSARANHLIVVGWGCNSSLSGKPLNCCGWGCDSSVPVKPLNCCGMRMWWQSARANHLIAVGWGCDSSLTRQTT